MERPYDQHQQQIVHESKVDWMKLHASTTQRKDACAVFHFDLKLAIAVVHLRAKEAIEDGVVYSYLVEHHEYNSVYSDDILFDIVSVYECHCELILHYHRVDDHV